MRLPTLATMVELYGTSMGLTLEARQFLRQMEQLRRLALNAELLTVRVGRGAEVFQTLAREVGRLATQANGVIQALHGGAMGVAGKAVRSAALARLCEKYQLAVERGSQGPTLERIQRRIDLEGRAMVADLAAIAESLTEAKSKLADLERLSLQLPMIATLLNIEANRDAGTDPALTQNAKSLLTLRGELTGLLDRIRAQADRTLTALRAAT